MFNKIILCTLLLFTLTFSNSLYSEVNWSEPSTIFSSKDLENQQIAFNDAGQGIAVWTKNNLDQFTSDIFYSSCENSKWSKPEVLTSASSFFGYTVAINSSGKAIVVWNKMAESGPIPSYCIVEAALFDGRSWGKIQKLHNNTFGGEFISIPKVALSESNEALVTWITTTDGENFQLLALTYKDQTWSKPATLTTDIAAPGDFDIALNNSGQGIVAWINSANAIDVKMYARSNWSPSSKTISLPNVINYAKIIASFADLSHPGVLWVSQNRDQQPTCEFSWLEDSGNWMTPASLGFFGGQDIYYRFDLAVNTHGEGLAAWGGGDGLLNVNHFRSANQPVIATLSTNFNANSGNVKVSINEKGNGAAIWNEGPDTLKGNICFGTEWLPEPHAFSNTLEEATMGQITFDQTNKATALWINAKGVNGEDSLQTASGKENTDGGISYAINLRAAYCNQNDSIKVEWSPASDPKVKGYALYRNNFLIAQFPVSQTKYIDCHNKGTIVYRIDVLNQNNQAIAASHTKLN